MIDLECKCDCHEDNASVMHIVPCCERCSICGKRIKGNVGKHKKKCTVETRAQYEGLHGPMTDAEFLAQVRYNRSHD